MIADLKPYPEYKESGQEWLGHVPSHWEVRRTKFLLREMDSRSVTGKEQLLRVSQYTGVTQRKSADGSDAPDTRASSLKGYKIVRKSDLVINIMLAWNGSMGVSRFDGIASPAYCVYRLNPEVMPWYFHELLRLPAYKGRIKSASTGVVESRLRLYSDDLGCIEALLPPPAEQAAIVRFLDHWNGRLEKAIRSKRRVIALLQEQKQAIIHRAVTRGLDPNVKLKDSGIPWLGDVPEHWEVRPLKYLSRRIQNGATPPSDSPHYFENGTIPWYGPASINSGIYVGNPSKLINRVALLDGKARLMKAPLLLVVVIGTVGKMALLQEDGATNQQITAFELRTDRILPEFLTLQVKSAEPWLHASASSSTIPILDSGLLKRVAVAAPSIEEQQVVLNFIASATSSLDTAITRYEREITLLREYRTRLTADVVTGKLDVRAAAAQVPDLEDATIPDEAENFEEEPELEEVEG